MHLYLLFTDLVGGLKGICTITPLTLEICIKSAKSMIGKQLQLKQMVETPYTMIKTCCVSTRTLVKARSDLYSIAICHLNRGQSGVVRQCLPYPIIVE